MKHGARFSMLRALDRKLICWWMWRCSSLSEKISDRTSWRELDFAMHLRLIASRGPIFSRQISDRFCKVFNWLSISSSLGYSSDEAGSCPIPRYLSFELQIAIYGKFSDI